MITIQQRYELLRQARRFLSATDCVGHDFSDETRDKTKRLRSGELQCTRCGAIVTVVSAFFYEQGVTHGSKK
jgi:hypothetical protein